MNYFSLYNKKTVYSLLLVFIFFLDDIYASEVNVCLNLTIVTKPTQTQSESKIYTDQIDTLKNQVQQVEKAFKFNESRNCPVINITIENIVQISWKEALNFSVPLDQKFNENTEEYKKRKKTELEKKILALDHKMKANDDFNEHDFLLARPGLILLEAKKLNIQNSNSGSILIALENIKNKLKLIDPEDKQLKREKSIIEKYKKIDDKSAKSWSDGILLLWNDIEVQDVSTEARNMLRFTQQPDNQCINIFSVPSSQSPSKGTKEVEINGDWSHRGGAALSKEFFPLTTAGNGHAIILTQNISPGEYRLAHELGHILIGTRNAHQNKQAKDLMYEKSEGGSFLSNEECQRINDYLQ
ncbi:MAG: hypothetical protein AAF410_05000 [Pseudomonadota bacterium]